MRPRTTDDELRQVVGMLAAGTSDVRIAHELHMSASGMRGRIRMAERRFGAANRTHLIALAFGAGWLSSEMFKGGTVGIETGGTP